MLCWFVALCCQEVKDTIVSFTLLDVRPAELGRRKLLGVAVGAARSSGSVNDGQRKFRQAYIRRFTPDKSQE